MTGISPIFGTRAQKGCDLPAAPRSIQLFLFVPVWQMTTACTEFNDALLEFVDQLVQVFPEVPELAAYNAIAPDIVKNNPDVPARMFYKATQNHAVRILARDPAFFQECPTLLNIDMNALWQKDLSDESRGVIWTYIGHLYTLAFQASLTPEAFAQLNDVTKDKEKMEKLQDLAKSVFTQMEGAGLDVQQLLGGLIQNPSLK